jgi:hypothetical protein
MPLSPRVLAVWCMVVGLTGCSHTVAGTAARAPAGIDDDSHSPVDVETIMLDQSQMRAITGAGEDLTVIPSMDGKFPVDIDQLAENAPPQCHWVFAETQTFGPDVEEFHKTTYQDPPDAGLISQGAAAYRDPATARGAFDALVTMADECASTPLGPTFIGDVTADSDAMRARFGACGRDYRVKSVVLVEVTFCRFPESVPGIVMTNILRNVPG